MSLTESVRLMEAYLTEKATEVAQEVASAGVVAKENPAGQAANAIQGTAATATLAGLAQNPIVAAGADTLNQIGTTIAQQLVTNALQKVNFSAVQNASQSFFQAWATVSTLQSELAMELARNTARNITTLTERKRGIINSIQAELTALHNACIILLNSSPFFTEYLQKLIEAYGKIQQADTKFATTVQVLQRQGRYQSRRFESGVSDLEAAQSLILPDRGADVSSIRAVGDFVSATIGRQTNAQALAAAQAIPGISLKLGRLMIDYAAVTTEINLLLNTFIDALDGFVASFQRNQNIDQVTVDHINAGRAQIGSLLAEMQPVLFPPSTNNGGFDPTQATYPPKVSAQATMWGVRLQAIIEWMKLNPGKGSQTLQQTQDSVQAYLAAVQRLNNQGNITYTGGQLTVNESREDVEGAITLVARLMIVVNTIVATQTTRADVTARFRTVRRHFDAALRLTNNIDSNIQPFINTQGTLAGPARAAINQALGIANQFGLDRVAGLLSDGKVRELFGLQPDQMTYAGSAVVGVNQLVAEMRTNPNISETQVESIEGVRDAFAREKRTKDIEAGRSYGTTIAAAQEEAKRKFDEIKNLIFPALEAAKEIDQELVENPVSSAERQMSNVIPGFAANNRYLS